MRDLLLRLFPHATRTGLRRLGNPGPTDPVLLTGNYALTVRRLEKALEGRNAWLLVANSNGINVWCAAGGGHLTHHDVIAVIRSSAIADHVDHHELVLPQLCATGVERRLVSEATGWRTRWGPARLEDLPEFLERGSRLRREHRKMRFPAWERLEMSTMWALPMSAIAGLVVGLAVGWQAALASVLGLFGAVVVLFLALPHLVVVGPRRWATQFGFAVIGAGIGSGVLLALGALNGPGLIAVGASNLIGMLVLSVDLTGTTPWYPSQINSFENQFDVELVEQRCTGAAECVQVCPRDVLKMDGSARKVQIARPENCLRCGACIVQCPDDALQFRFTDGRVVEPSVVRSTRLNMLGRRSVTLRS